MKKSLTTIFSLSLLLSVASPVFGACSMEDQKKATWKTKRSTRDTICCDKDSTRRLVNAGLIASLTVAATPIVKEVLENALLTGSADWLADNVPFLNRDRLAKVCAVLAAAVGGSWIIRENLAKKLLNLF